jgi:uncharacterized Tic20 family protein
MENITWPQKALAALAHGGWLLAGVGYLLLPFIIWLCRRSDPFVAWHAKQAMICQLLYIVLLVVLTVAGALVFGVQDGGGVWLLVAVLIILGLVWFACAVVAIVKALNGELYTYPGLQRFMKKENQ